MITTHEELLKLHGKSITCEINGTKVEDAKICVEGDRVFICQNILNGIVVEDKLGYKYSLYISSNESSYEDVKGFGIVKSIQLVEEQESEIQEVIQENPPESNTYENILKRLTNLEEKVGIKEKEEIKYWSEDDVAIRELEYGTEYFTPLSSSFSLFWEGLEAEIELLKQGHFFKTKERAELEKIRLEHKQQMRLMGAVINSNDEKSYFVYFNDSNNDLEAPKLGEFNYFSPNELCFRTKKEADAFIYWAKQKYTKEQLKSIYGVK